MDIRTVKHTYRSGPNKGVTTTRFECRNAPAPMITVSEILGQNTFGVSYASTHICDGADVDTGLKVAEAIQSQMMDCRHDIHVMRDIANTTLTEASA